PVLLSAPDREILRGLLASIPIGDVADAVADVAELTPVADLKTLSTWRDTARAIRIMERMPAVDGIPPLVTFVDRLANVVTGTTADDLQAWVDTVTGGLGVSPSVLAELRATGMRTRPGGSVLQEPVAAPAGIPHDERRPRRPRRTDETGLIWGGVPIR